MIKGTPEYIKVMNRNTVLSLIVKKKSISRAAISTLTNLSKSTVSSIVEELLSENIIMENGEGISTKLGGRKPIELVFNPSAGYIIGIDIGASKSICVICDLSGRILIKEVLQKKNYDSNDYLNLIINTVKKMAANLGLGDKIIGVGVGIPGTADIENGIARFVPKLDWIDFPICDVLKKEFGVDVFIDNDVNMAVYGEKWLGVGKEYNNCVFISIGDGIGSGIIIDNKIYRGHNYTGGEIGYLVLSKDALQTEKYTPDAYGYFESVASGSAIERKFGISCKEVFEKASHNDIECIEAVNEMTEYLSMGIANIVSVLSPQAVIIGGGVSKAGLGLLLSIRKEVSRLTPVKTEIVLSELEDNAGVLGCVGSVLAKKYGISFY
ncbi:ROK family transcriptional regulator [Ruminiclostridium herbifermentans]|uniref:ROK family transcriptional regulator n=1 Tax=Ruminiclostridium herbifermentans TaxID=2488810 RepID=A0A4U7JKJ8_9FIRM|nr:ROK family transcriptional regulator [Ruminiclostridium herbifermentans]QNU68658.1 ROK family transcriptional regulator [Ruminiclostridium herbifermentans]